MKKLINILFLIFLCPIVFGAVNALPNAPQTTAQTNFDKSLTINSADLGVNGPVSFGILYSDNFGAMLQAKLLQGLNKNNAIGLELEGGQGQRRVNATWGFGFTPNQRIKFTAENLAQKMEFDFDSGKTKRWVDQNAYGFGYEYLISNSFINDINVNAFYSRAISQSLSSRNYSSSGINYINYRHIAGGTDKSGSIGVDLLPSHSTLIGLQANYDHVDYNMRYEKDINESGLGATITLNQLISNHVKFNLLASNRKPYDDYQAGINWLLNSAPGTQLELGVNGEYLEGSHGIDNDTKGGITLAYSWGGNSIGHPSTYSDFGTAASNSITSFTNTPAVHMQQVLAVRDQKSVQVVTSSSKTSTTNNTITVTVHPGAIDLPIQKYIASNDTNLNDYSVTGLPKQLTYNDGNIIGTLTKQNIGQYSVTIQNNLTDNIVTLLLLVKNNEKQPYANPSYTPSDLKFATNYTIDPQKDGTFYHGLVTEKTPKGLFVDPEWRMNTLKLSVTGLPSDSGLTATFTPDPTKQDNGTLTISGTTSNTPAVYHVQVHASNLYGDSTDTQNFTITVGEIQKPSIDMNTQQFSFHQTGVSNDLTQYVHAGSGDVASISSDQLQSYGLQFKCDPTSHKITIINKDGTPAVPAPTLSTININDVHITNSLGGEITDGAFKIEISGPPVWQSNPDNPPTYNVGDTITPIQLDNHFAIPVNSGAISSWNIEVKSQDGTVDYKGASEVQNNTGLEIANNQLTGTLKAISNHSPYNVILTAINDHGDSIDAQGNPKNAEFTLTVNTPTPPSTYYLVAPQMKDIDLSGAHPTATVLATTDKAGTHPVPSQSFSYSTPYPSDPKFTDVELRSVSINGSTMECMYQVTGGSGVPMLLTSTTPVPQGLKYSSDDTGVVSGTDCSPHVGGSAEECRMEYSVN